MADKSKNPVTTGELSKMIANLEKAHRSRKSVFGSADQNMRQLDSRLAEAEAGVLLGASRLDALSELSEREMTRSLQIVSTEETNVQQALATSYNVGTQEIQEAVEDYSRRLSELYWQSTQISVSLGDEGNQTLTNKYIPIARSLIEAINTDPLFATERAKTLFQLPLLEYAHKIKSLMESRSGLFSRLSISAKSFIRNDVVAGVLSGAASKNPLIALAAFAYQRRTRSNTYASRLSVEQQRLGLRKTVLSRTLAQQTRLSERVSEGSPSPSVRGNTLTPAETPPDSAISSSITSRSVEKILLQHTMLLDKIYGVLNGALRFQQQQLASQLAADEESSLETQDTASKLGYTNSLNGSSSPNTLRGDSWVDDIVGGAIGTAIGKLFPRLIGLIPSVAKSVGGAVFAGGAVLLANELLKFIIPSYANFGKLQSGGDVSTTQIATASATAPAIYNAIRTPGSQASLTGSANPITSGNVLNLGPEPTATRQIYRDPITGRFVRAPQAQSSTVGSILFQSTTPQTASNLRKFINQTGQNFSGGMRNLATSRGLLKAGPLLAAYGAYTDYSNRRTAGQTTTQAGIGAGAGLGGGIVGGMAAGAATGAALGTWFPGIGNIAGGLIGAGVGLTSSYFGAKYGGELADKLTGVSSLQGENPTPQSNKTSFSQLNKEQQDAVLAAQAKFEHGSSIKNNNPGNIMYSYPNGVVTSYARKFGGMPSNTVTSHGILAYFPSMEIGREAQRALWLSPKYKDLPIVEAIKRWAPGAPDSYATSLVKATTTPSVTVPVSINNDMTSNATVAPSTPEQQGRSMTTQGISYNPTSGVGPNGEINNYLVNMMKSQQPPVISNGNGNIPAPIDREPTIRRILDGNLH